MLKPRRRRWTNNCRPHASYWTQLHCERLHLRNDDYRIKATVQLSEKPAQLDTNKIKIYFEIDEVVKSGGSTAAAATTITTPTTASSSQSASLLCKSITEAAQGALKSES